MLDKQADPARSKDKIHPQAVARAVSELASARRGLRLRHRPEHALVGQLDPRRAARSGSSARSTTRRSAPRWVRPTACRRWIVRAR